MSMKKLMIDLNQCLSSKVFFLFEDNEIKTLKASNSEVRGLVCDAERDGIGIGDIGVIVGFRPDKRRDQYFIAPRDVVERLSRIWDKPISQIPNEDRFFFGDCIEEMIDVLK